MIGTFEVEIEGYYDRHIVIRGGGRHAPQRQEDLESLRKAAISAPFQKRFAIAGAFNRRYDATAGQNSHSSPTSCNEIPSVDAMV